VAWDAAQALRSRLTDVGVALCRRRREPVQAARPPDERCADARRGAASAEAVIVGQMGLDQASREIRHPRELVDRLMPSSVI
jgi:hypothetical protein